MKKLKRRRLILAKSFKSIDWLWILFGRLCSNYIKFLSKTFFFFYTQLVFLFSCRNFCCQEGRQQSPENTTKDILKHVNITKTKSMGAKLYDNSLDILLLALEVSAGLLLTYINLHLERPYKLLSKP